MFIFSMLLVYPVVGVFPFLYDGSVVREPPYRTRFLGDTRRPGRSRQVRVAASFVASRKLLLGAGAWPGRYACCPFYLSFFSFSSFGSGILESRSSRSFL